MLFEGRSGGGQHRLVDLVAKVMREALERGGGRHPGDCPIDDSCVLLLSVNLQNHCFIPIASVMMTCVLEGEGMLLSDEAKPRSLVQSCPVISVTCT